MKSLRLCIGCGCLALLTVSIPGLAQDKAPVIKPDAKAAYEKLGALGHLRAHITDHGFYHSIGMPPTQDSFVAFEFVREPQGELPDPAIPFSLRFAHGALTEAGLKELGGLKHLVALTADGYAITDETMKDVARITKLRALVIQNSLLTGEGLQELAGLPELTVLDLTVPRLTDAGLAELAALKNLKVLALSGTKVTPAGLKALAKIKGLRTLSLGNQLMTDANLGALREAGLLHKLRNASGKGDTRPASPDDVETLRLPYLPISEAALREFAVLKNVTFLELTSTNVTDAGLKEVARFKKLATLELFKTRVTDAGLKELESLRNLTNLNLRDTEVTSAGLQYLNEALPNCKVHR
jgi:Leucine-rich repeat (LRR) protein